MNKLLPFILLIACVFFTTCEKDREHSNPVDPETELDPSEWAPSNLQAEVINDSEIKLTWTQEVEQISGFRIERKTGSGSFSQIVEVEKVVREYTDTGITVGTDYTYRVKAFTDDNESGYATSNTTNTTFPSPTNLTSTPIDDQSIQLNWSDNCSFESGYRLERSSGGGFIQIAELEANVTEYTDTGLNYGTDYFYGVKAFTDDNESDYATSNMTNTSFPSPSNLVATPLNDTDIQLTWSDNCDFESGYRLERSDGGSFTQIAELEANVTEYTDTGLTLGIAYTYKVKAFTDANESDYWVTTVNFWQDCLGVWGGIVVEDCNGVCGGTAIENECGCVGGNTGLETDYCYGCTDLTALNYDPDATVDDGSCITITDIWQTEADFNCNGNFYIDTIYVYSDGTLLYHDGSGGYWSWESGSAYLGDCPSCPNNQCGLYGTVSYSAYFNVGGEFGWWYYIESYQGNSGSGRIGGTDDYWGDFNIIRIE